jgi:hypothetical protein
MRCSFTTFLGYDEVSYPDIGTRNGIWPSVAEPAKINILTAVTRVRGQVESLPPARRPISSEHVV